MSKWAIFDLAVILQLLGTTSVLFWTFLDAYHQESKTVIVAINNYGEATFELIGLSVLLLFGFILVIWKICKLRHKR